MLPSFTQAFTAFRAWPPRVRSSVVRILSLESQAPNLRNLDTAGHGTFMAGLIAGKDSTLTVP